MSCGYLPNFLLWGYLRNRGHHSLFCNVGVVYVIVFIFRQAKFRTYETALFEIVLSCKLVILPGVFQNLLFGIVLLQFLVWRQGGIQFLL